MTTAWVCGWNLKKKDRRWGFVFLFCHLRLVVQPQVFFVCNGM